MAGSKLINSPLYDPHEPFDHVMQQIFGFEGKTIPSMLGFLQDYASLWDESDWIKDKQAICSVMESYSAGHLPVLQGLARHYAVSDLWFASVPTQTNPNRAFLTCGTSEGQIVNGFCGKSTFSADTIWNRLQEAASDTAWTIFWQTDMIPGLFRYPFSSPQTFSALGRIPNIEEHYQKIDSFHELARRGELPDFSFIEPQWTICEATQLGEIKKTYNSERLIGFYGNDFHPPGDVRAGENLLANIYTSLISNKEAWEKTLLVVLFDEHGGIFDHVSPPPSLAPDDHFENGFAFDRYGVRVPALFISPRIKKGTVVRSDSPDLPFDHTSVIATTLKWKNIDPENWNMGKRVAAAPTFETVITETVPRNDPIIAEQQLAADEGQTLNMGDPIFLKDPQGNYLVMSGLGHYATVSSTAKGTSLQFCPSGGKMTHGSFVLIKLNDPSLSADYLLDNSSMIGDCYYNENSHQPSQWWTLKSADHPYVGYEIQSGDRVYLECHLYREPTTSVPGRLATSFSFLLGQSVATKAITEQNIGDYYWIIEKVE